MQSGNPDLDPRRAALVAAYPALWQHITDEWRRPGDDRLWLTYSANYLLRTGGVRWALDPLTLGQRLPQAPPVDVGVLSGAAFIALTHRHADHLDLGLVSALSEFPIFWIVPQPLRREVIGAGLRRERLLTPIPGQPLKLNGVRLTPFDGLHWEARPGGGMRGVPAMGYLAEFNGCDGRARRWLFPGDTRSYDAGALPAFDSPDGVLAHVWLGRGAAQSDPPPLLDDFCRFHLALRPRRIVLAHLNEHGRSADDLWDDRHAGLASAHFALLGLSAVETARTGESIAL